MHQQGQAAAAAPATGPVVADATTAYAAGLLLQQWSTKF